VADRAYSAPFFRFSQFPATPTLGARDVNVGAQASPREPGEFPARRAAHQLRHIGPQGLRRARGRDRPESEAGSSRRDPTAPVDS